MTTKKTLSLVISLLLAALFLWLLSRHVQAAEVGQVLMRANPWYVTAAVAAVVIGYSCRIERWRLLLAWANPHLRWSDCAGPFAASFAANNVLPFRAGDVMRAFAFSSELGTTSGVVLATVFVERLLDLLIVVGMLGAALATFGLNASSMVGVSGTILFAAAAALLFLLHVPRLLAPLAHAVTGLLTRWFPRHAETIATEAARCFSTLDHIAGSKHMKVLFLWSTASWVAEGCAYWAVAYSLPVLARPVAAWLALPVGALATLLPSTPGSVGTFDYFAARAMTTVGNDISSATAYAFLIHAVVWLPPTLVGCCYLLLRPIRESKKHTMSS